MLDMNSFITWLEHSSRRQMFGDEGADEAPNKWSSRPAQGKPVARRGRKARGLVGIARRPSCQFKATCW
jgi:hypothetical protein